MERPAAGALLDMHLRSAPLILLLTLAGTPLVGCAGGRPIAHTMDDAAITAGVKAALLNDPQVNATNINVTTAGGVVTMSGAVKSDADAQRAVQLARGVAGVKDVRSQLRVGG